VTVTVGAGLGAGLPVGVSDSITALGGGPTMVGAGLGAGLPVGICVLATTNILPFAADEHISNGSNSIRCIAFFCIMILIMIMYVNYGLLYE